jgi:VanZ family protein
MAVFVVAFTPLKFNIHKITVNIISFKFHLDQVLHAIVYFLICMYFLTGKYRGLKLFKSNSIIEFLIVLLILATITEVVQLTVPSRTFNVFDIAANFVGIVVGIIVISLAEGCRLSR